MAKGEFQALNDSSWLCYFGQILETKEAGTSYRKYVTGTYVTGLWGHILDHVLFSSLCSLISHKVNINPMPQASAAMIYPGTWSEATLG